MVLKKLEQKLIGFEMTFIHLREKPCDNQTENSGGSAHDEVVLGDNANGESQISITAGFKETCVDLNITHDRS